MQSATLRDRDNVFCTQHISPTGEGWVAYFWFAMRRLHSYLKTTTSFPRWAERKLVCLGNIGLSTMSFLTVSARAPALRHRQTAQLVGEAYRKATFGGLGGLSGLALSIGR